MASAFKAILERVKPRRPERLQTDKGKEFYNAQFKKVLGNIEHFSSESDQKAAGVERWNRTLKSMMFRYMRHKNTEKWTDILQHFVDSYNVSKHSRLGTSPSEALKMDNAQLYHMLYGTKATKGPPPKATKRDLLVGQKVRITQARWPFTKGYWGGWTLEHFMVSEVLTRYHLKIYKLAEENGSAINGIFYRHELEPISDNTYYIEKILQTRGNQHLIKWLGWPKEYNSWIKKTDITI